LAGAIDIVCNLFYAWSGRWRADRGPDEAKQMLMRDNVLRVFKLGGSCM